MYAELFLARYAWSFLNGSVERFLFMRDGCGAINSPTPTPTKPATITNTRMRAIIFLFIEPSDPATVVLLISSVN
jgi:hypothetical protein